MMPPFYALSALPAPRQASGPRRRFGASIACVEDVLVVGQLDKNGNMTEPLYHIAEATTWEQANQDGIYRQSTVGRTVDEEGFIHCAYARQVEAVANIFYRGRSGLVLLVIDPTRVVPDIREEDGGEGRQRFPHIFGPLNLDAVVDARPLASGPDGLFHFSL
jgi:uncharacterized protein (DUF952 family)